MAKIRNEQLITELKKSITPIYLISGDEHLLVEEAKDCIRHHAQDKGFQRSERYESNSRFDWTQLLSASNNFSLFSEKKLVELHMINGKPGDKGSKVICEYLEQNNTDTCLLITTPKLDSGTQRSKWVKAIEKHGYWLSLWPIKGQALLHWIEQRLQKMGLSADSQSIELLATRTEGNLLATHQEIEKLALINEETYLTPELVASSVVDSARFDLFGLIDKSLQQDRTACIRHLLGLKAEGTEPSIILWGLTREIRALLLVTQEMANGRPFNQASKIAGIWNQRQALIKHALNYLNSKKLERLLRQAHGIDKAIKGIRKADPWNELLELTLNLSGTASLHSHNIRLSLQY